ncbi:MAG: hypothetical protein J6W51_05455 [Fibrobacter sp.]|nr:hypothetical protein [Fibrobacter sp.]
MFTKVRQILGKIFLSGASFFWVSCDSASSAEEPGPLIDIEQEMAKLTPPDTSGLRGQCTSVRDYCDVIDDYHTPLSNGYDAKAPARDKVNERLNSKNLSDAERKCYERLAESLSLTEMPLYGVPYCYDFSLIEEFQDIVLPPDIDDAYLNNRIKSKQEDYQRYLKDHNLTACAPVTKGVFIDDQYINAALKNEQSSRDSFRSDLEYINKQAAECDALE